jgi:hypothetical protein
LLPQIPVPEIIYAHSKAVACGFVLNPRFGSSGAEGDGNIRGAWFRRGLASNLNRLGVDDSVIQRILRHSTVATTQNHYIKTASPDVIAAMKQFSEALLCSTCAPDGDIEVKGAVQ